ncbi:MAG: AsnC family transcriptional regulator [Thermoproteota archaeon]|nr:MAG: AsnC family transcriptional regulator [Candidatus Korarchaeota archaeon]RLG52090.1 MAG: AsnC family transcriptional regulator [Candidatus Korarchaeota archaeon]
MDELDRKILKSLIEDGRASYREISKRVGAPPATVHARVKKLMSLGVIKGFAPVIDPVKLGLELTALILVRASGPYLVEVEKDIAEYENVCAVYDITGEYDIAVVARFRGREELNRFVKRLLAHRHVERTFTSIVLNVVKEDFTPRP